MSKFTDPDAQPSKDRESINTERIVAGFRQKIWEHWLHGNGVCGDCPIRCENQGFDPLFGLFNYNANLMIIAREPGTFSDFAESGDGKGRIYRTMPEEKAIKNHPHLVEQRGYEHKAIHDWKALMKGATRLFDPDYYSNSETGRPSVGLSIQDSYYTNALKCSRLSGEVKDVDKPEEKNQNAREKCQEYLKKEIELVSPQVIVTFGGNAWTDTVRALEMENKVEHTKYLNRNINADPEFGFGAFGSSPTVIPSYHWSNLGQQKSKIGFLQDGFEGKMYDKYYSELVHRINDKLH